MPQSKIDPGDTDISLAGKPKQPGKMRDKAGDKDLHPERKLQRPASKKHDQPKAGPLDRGIDLGD